MRDACNVLPEITDLERRVMEKSLRSAACEKVSTTTYTIHGLLTPNARPHSQPTWPKLAFITAKILYRPAWIQYTKAAAPRAPNIRRASRTHHIFRAKARFVLQEHNFIKLELFAGSTQQNTPTQTRSDTQSDLCRTEQTTHLSSATSTRGVIAVLIIIIPQEPFPQPGNKTEKMLWVPCSRGRAHTMRKCVLHCHIICVGALAPYA